MKKKKISDLKIGVLAGGKSSERKISILTGKAIRSALDRLGFKNRLIEVDGNIVSNLKKDKIDLAFLALHGRGGEDGSIQGLLEIVGIPYTGSGILASAVGMNKIFTKEILIAHKITTPKFMVLERADADRVESFKLPFVVKPEAQGSAVGINIVFDKNEIAKALQSAFSYDNRILIEEYIPGKEITVGILGEEVLPVIEIVPRKTFYDFEAKYKKGMSKHIIPAGLPDDIYKKAQHLALKVHNVLGCRDISRTDMIYNPGRGLFVLEINTIPGMTNLSLIPDAARAMGIEFDEIVKKMVIWSAARAGLIE